MNLCTVLTSLVFMQQGAIHFTLVMSYWPMGEEPRSPVPGVDYPRTLVEFEEWFSSEEACVEYLRRLRWGDGFRCPACGGEKTWPTGRGQLRCAACQRQTSPIAGTIFQGTRAPLRVVPGDVARHQPEAWRQCAGAPTGPGSW